MEMEAQLLNSLKEINPDDLIKFAEMARALQEGGNEVTQRQSSGIVAAPKLSKGSQAKNFVKNLGKGGGNQGQGAQHGTIVKAPVVSSTPRQTPANGRSFGTVKSYNDREGFGFITCPEQEQVYGQDVFLHKNEFYQAQLFVGAEVSFTIQLNSAKQPQAVDVEQIGGWKGGVKRPHPGNWASSAPKKGKGKGKAPAVQHYTPVIKKHQTPFVEKAAPQQLDGGPYTGILKSFNQHRGFGFIACDETFAAYERDVFMHKNETDKIHDLTKGDTLTFTLQINQEGHPQAVGVTKEDAYDDF